MAHRDTDVVILGGGMVGATLAWGLSRQHPDWTVDVVELVPPRDELQPSFDDRVIALSAGSVEALKELALWPELAKLAQPIHHIHVSERGGFGQAQLHRQDYRVDALGQVLAVRDMGALLHKRLGDSGVRWHCPDSLEAVEQGSDGHALTLKSGTRLHCRLLVVAEGGNSPGRARLGIGHQVQDYHQTAIIANIQTSQPHDGWAYERFTPTGPLALLPMTEGRMNLVLCVRPEEQEQLLALHSDQFARELQRRFGWRLGAIEAVGLRHAYPLKLITADQIRGHRSVILGNAAHSLHPIAGQGFNLGLRDLVDLLACLRDQDDPGHYQALARWQARREPDLRRTIGTTDGLVSLFANDWAGLKLGRNLGLSALHHLPALKEKLAWQMLGWRS
ncbi:2-octaprenyl-6-methoxyphenyl hydroxylase [Gallaecimonas sp. GXIMD4217]|uniref:2-octaprenyl-6-methoxyphenyl hydroxylase n=1 Tax=Gallaecimonas sp. GXIMD4217 TaxID=3131927 RepID=UPI00311B19BF